MSPTHKVTNSTGQWCNPTGPYRHIFVYISATARRTSSSSGPSSCGQQTLLDEQSCSVFDLGCTFDSASPLLCKYQLSMNPSKIQKQCKVCNVCVSISQLAFALACRSFCSQRACAVLCVASVSTDIRIYDSEGGGGIYNMLLVSTLPNCSVLNFGLKSSTFFRFGVRKSLLPLLVLTYRLYGF